MLGNHVVKERWAVLYCHSTSNSKFSSRRIFKNYGLALELFSRGCNFIDADYDGYNYVALLWDDGEDLGFRPISWRDNLGCAWDLENYSDG